METITAPGKPWYYALLHSTQEEREIVVLLLNLENTWRHLRTDSEEVSVQEAKMQWWRHDLAKLALGQPQHPLLSALQVSPRLKAHYPQILMDILDGLVSDDLRVGLAARKEMLSLLACVLSSEERHPMADKLADMIVSVEWIQGIRWEIEDKSAFNQAAGFSEMQRLVVLYREAKAGLSRQHKRALYPLWARAVSSMALLHEMAEDKFNVWQYAYHLTPLRLWWLGVTARYFV